MASIIDVAKKAGVGKSTVSRYLNGSGYVSKANAEKIGEAIKELNYEPNSLGRMLKLNKSYTLALCVPMLSHPFFSKFAEALEKALYEAGGEDLSKLVILSEREGQLEQLVSRKQIDGLIIVTHRPLEESTLSIPMVTIDRVVGKVPCTTSDNYEASAKALEYLYGKGYRRIGFIGGCPKVPSEVTRRHDAYLDFVASHSLEDLSWYQDFMHGEECRRADEYLSSHPDLDAVLATSDSFAFALYRCSLLREKPLPIIAYDGCMDDWIQTPRFTSLVQDIDQMASKALETILALLGGEKRTGKSVVPTLFRKGDTA